MFGHKIINVGIILFVVVLSLTLQCNGTLTSLEKSVTSLHQSLTDLTGTVKGRKAEIDALKKMIENEEQKVTSLEQTLTNVSIGASFHKAEMDDLNETIEKREEKGSDLVKKLQSLEEQLKQQDKKESPVSAFRYGYRYRNKITKGSTMIYSGSYFNLGDDFNPTTGIYTAPTLGLYVFHMSLWTYGTNRSINVSIRVNGQDQAELYAHDKDTVDQSSVNALLRLEKGDVVEPYVKDVTKSDKVWSTQHSYLSGYLLQSL